ncbi:MAG: hypothetical protein C3F02_02720 [Parcubacteria group bacterium]|nr:MAG: hypothetical protein C3F02_02720 [Parcubacteria group bacterium]
MQWQAIKSYLPYKMKRQVRELFISTTLVNLALAMVMIFEPIYLYKIGYNLQSIMLFYLITYIFYFLLMPIGAKFAKRYGYEMSIFVGTILFILFYLALFFIARYPILFYLSPIILAIQKTFYWPAYHADFARFSDDSEEGRELSSMTVATSLVYVIGPAIAGFIVVNWGYGALFTLASVIFLASNIPTLITREEFAPSLFSYGDTYRNLFNRKNRRSFLAYAGYGEELVVLVIWPIFISLIITNMFDLGLIVALATLVTTIITFYIGKLTDYKNKRPVLYLGSAIYAISWYIRLFITTTVGVFFVDSLSRLGKNVVTIPMTAITYENAKDLQADKHHHLMSGVVFFEMSLVIGKLFAILVIYGLLFLVSADIIAFKLTFILAGGMTLLYMLL